MSLADLFPSGPHRFQAGLERADAAGFFRAQDATGRVRAERARLLAEAPELYAGLVAGGQPLLEEFAERCAGWGIPISADLIEAGSTLEPDFLLLEPGSDGFVLRGGVVCFPSSWALAEKLGHPMAIIHAPVPGLNASLAPMIHRILAGLKDGQAFGRANWGLAATDDLNMHPSRNHAGPQPPADLRRLWLRIERQVLVRLPRSQGVAFGIRLELARLDELAREPAAADGLARALETMTPEVAAYKRLDLIRDDLIRVLRL